MTTDNWQVQRKQENDIINLMRMRHSDMRDCSSAFWRNEFDVKWISIFFFVFFNFRVDENGTVRMNMPWLLLLLLSLYV